MAGRIPPLVRHLRERTRRHFVTGVLVIVPLWMTWYVLVSLVRWMDRVLVTLIAVLSPRGLVAVPRPRPRRHPDAAGPSPVRRGSWVRTFLGRPLVRELESLLRRIPVVRWT